MYIWTILKRFFYYYEYKVKPDWFPIISIGPDDKNYNPKQEDDAAKFNYEVMYLVESAYNHANKIQTQDELLLKASLLNNLFCIKNALRKMNESLLGCSGRIDRELVSDSMITVALELVIATINILQSYNSDITCMYQDEIDFVRGLYDDTKKQIKLEYGIWKRNSSCGCENFSPRYLIFLFKESLTYFPPLKFGNKEISS